MNMKMTLNEMENECKALLMKTNRPKIDALIKHIERMGFFIAPGSLGHHRFVGGLLRHSLETYHKAMELRERKIGQGVDASLMPIESVVIAALMHDLCKADALRYSIESHKVYAAKKTHGHSSRSVRQVGYSGFVLTEAEKLAILWHMGGKKMRGNRQDHFKSHPLSEIIYWADKLSIRERH